MKSSDFVFDSVYLFIHLMYYKCHKINMNCGGSYTDAPDWIKKKAEISTINKKDNKCFQYVVTVVSNHEEIGKHAERITKIKPLMNKHKREGINFPWEKDNWKKFEKINVAITLNILYVKKKKRKNVSCLCFKK